MQRNIMELHNIHGQRAEVFGNESLLWPALVKDWRLSGHQHTHTHTLTHTHTNTHTHTHTHLFYDAMQRFTAHSGRAVPHSEQGQRWKNTRWTPEINNRQAEIRSAANFCPGRCVLCVFLCVFLCFCVYVCVSVCGCVCVCVFTCMCVLKFMCVCM